MHFSNFLQLFSLMNKPGLWRKCENKRTMSNIYNNDISNSGNCYNCLYQNKQTPYFFPPVREKQNPPLLKLIWLAICLVFGSDRLIPHFWPHLGKKKKTNKPANPQQTAAQTDTHTAPAASLCLTGAHTQPRSKLILATGHGEAQNHHSGALPWCGGAGSLSVLHRTTHTQSQGSSRSTGPADHTVPRLGLAGCQPQHRTLVWSLLKHAAAFAVVPSLQMDFVPSKGQRVFFCFFFLRISHFKVNWFLLPKKVFKIKETLLHTEKHFSYSQLFIRSNVSFPVGVF